MIFEWDEAKEARNVRQRGLDFGTAAGMFSGPVMTWQDTRRDYGEVRVVALGEVEGRILVVVYTDRGDTRRIISAQPAKRKERELWQLFAKP
ncbi:MAG: BrnT family toxin [Pseudomonadota bacterium]|nr:BrnT family toxin [Pseudomonadota bacterium]